MVSPDVFMTPSDYNANLLDIYSRLFNCILHDWLALPRSSAQPRALAAHNQDPY
jgi:hypothetical protein